MDIQHKRTQYEPTADVLALVEKKLFSLSEKYLGEKSEAARAYVELGKAIGSHQTGNIWRAELNLDTEGERFRAEAVRSKITDAIDAASKELARELRRTKRKNEAFVKKGGAVIKSILRGFGGK